MPPRRPYIDDTSLYALYDAIELLALLRELCCPITDADDPQDPADVLHLAWSLSLHVDAALPHMIDDARDHGYSWNQILGFLTPPTT